MATAPENNIFTVNPYESHPSLSATESEVLWEYAKLAQNVKDLTAETRRLSAVPDEQLLGPLRVLERKMGLVLTLFKASVWGVINEQTVGENDPAMSSADATADTTLRR